MFGSEQGAIGQLQIGTQQEQRFGVVAQQMHPLRLTSPSKKPTVGSGVINRGVESIDPHTKLRTQGEYLLATALRPFLEEPQGGDASATFVICARRERKGANVIESQFGLVDLMGNRQPDRSFRSRTLLERLPQR